MAEAEGDIEELRGGSLVPRSSMKKKHSHPHSHTVFDSQQAPTDIDGKIFGDGVEQSSEDVHALQTPRSETLNVADYIVIVEDDSTPKTSLETDLEIRTDKSKGSSYSITAAAKTFTGDHSVAVNGDGDVERVIKEQETYDLFCPNCNSCITRTVILRRRIPEPPPQELVQEPQIFKEDAVRCLSCFTILIPISWKLKWPDRNPRQPPTSDAVASVPRDGSGWKGPNQDPTQLTASTASESVPQANPGWKEPDRDPTQLTTSTTPTNEAQADLVWKEPNRDPTRLTASTTPASMPQADLVWKGPHQDPPQQTTSTTAPTAVPQADLEIPENKVTVGQQEELLSDRAEPTKVVVSSTIDPHEVIQELDQTVITVAGSDTSAATTAAVLATTGGGDPRIDIIKSMLYGGLLESIASLSVVTSAAGADAKTLNIVALGAANMFGGIFVLAHNLRVLKDETSEERYEEVLGRPGHFTLHSVVAVISYIVFGLLPPVIYGFTFRESDNRDYKLIAVAMASLVCIILLALAKSYVRTPPKDYMKTLVYYLGIWIMTCGVSYVAGDLLDLLLQKLGWFESSGSIAIPFPIGEVGAMKMPWAST